MALALLATTVLSDPIYKVTQPDGRVVYSDQAPAKGLKAKVINIQDAPATILPPEVLKHQAALKAAQPVAKVDDSAQPVLFSAMWCPSCRKAKAYLAKRGTAYLEMDLDTPQGARAMAATGKPGIPLLMWRGKGVMGFSEASYEQILGSR